MLSTVDVATCAGEPSRRFQALFQRFYPALFSLTYRVLGDAQDVEETLQEAFSRLAGSPILARPEEEVSAWLRRVCLNLSFNRLRGERRARERLERAARLEPSNAVAPDPSGPAIRREQQAQVRLALARLPERQRECLLLRHSGYSYAEIASTLGVAVGSVGVMLARAERAFRDVYRENADELP